MAFARDDDHPAIAAETADIRDDRIDLFLRLRCF